MKEVHRYSTMLEMDSAFKDYAMWSSICGRDISQFYFACTIDSAITRLNDVFVTYGIKPHSFKTLKYNMHVCDRNRPVIIYDADLLDTNDINDYVNIAYRHLIIFGLAIGNVERWELDISTASAKAQITL